MHFLQLTFLYCTMAFFSGDQALEFPSSSPAKILESVNADSVRTNNAANIILQSKDGGQTWEDITNGLPQNGQPEGFFAGASDLYLHANNEMYHSNSNLNTPVWEKEIILDPRCNSIAFNRSGVMAYNYEGQIYQKTPSLGTWLPIYANFKMQLMRTIFETSDGSVFVGSDHGLYRSTDEGRNWKQVLHEGWVMDMVQSEGVLIATGQKGILRSTDNGEHWEWVISEGGVGIAIGKINGGFAAITYNAKTESRRIRISLDGGKNWTAIDGGLRASLSISSIKQMGRYLICGHPDGIFRSSDMGQTWSVVHPSVGTSFMTSVNWNLAPLRDDRKVFTIYVSGNVLYAVATNSGC